jgi:fibronectin-binding autotransporter adhesin
VKRLVFLIFFGLLSGVAFAQEVGNYPNASTPLLGTERILADQAASYPCTGCTVNLTPAQLSAYLATSGNLLPPFVTGEFLTNNGTTLSWASPSGSGTVESCSAGQIAYYNATGTTVTCLTVGTNLSITSGTLNASGSGSSAFSAITSGTNASAAMLVGTGASLGATGSGTITATAAPLAGISGLGTSVAGALATNVGSAGAFIIYGGAAGTPSAINLANATFPASISAITTLSGLTSANSSTIPASAGTLAGSTGAFTLNDCLKVGSVSPLEIEDNGSTCGSGGGMVYPGAGIPVSTGSAWSTSITPGTGVATALGVNVGSAGAFVVYGGALGTPSSGVATNLTGTASALNIGGTAANITATSNSTLTTLSALTSANGTTIPASASLAALGTANTWAAAQTFPSSDIIVKGSSTGTTTLASANSSASNYTITWPANTGTVGELNLAQTWSALQTFGTDISIGGVTPSGATGTGNLVFGTSPTLTTPALGTPSALTLTNATGLPPTTGISGWPANASGVLTNNGSGTLSWGTAGSGTVTDGSGTTTANGMLASTTTAHVYSVVTLAPTLSISSGVLGETAPTRTVTSSPTVASTDMGGLINSNVSGGGTLTIPAISSSIFASGMTLTTDNYSSSTEAISTTPTINSGGGCVSGTGMFLGSAWWMTSNGTTIDCIETLSHTTIAGDVLPASFTTLAASSTVTFSGISGSTQCLHVNSSGVVSGTGSDCGSGSGGVTTTGSPASTYLTAFSGTNTITGTANATLSGGALTLGVSGTLGSIQMGNATSGTVTLEPVTGALGTVTASLPANTGTIAETNIAQTWTNTNTFQYIRLNGTPAASTSQLFVVSAPYTAGTSTTNIPSVYLNPGSSNPTTFSTAGTEFGGNAPSGFTGNLEDWHVNGGSSVFSVTYQGNITAGTYNGVTIPSTSSTALTSPTTTTAGQCQESTTTAGLGQWVTCSGGGTVTTTGSPASGELTEFSGSTSITNGNLSGDVTTSGTLAATVVAIKGIAVAVATASSSTSVTPNCTNAFTKVTASATGTFTINAPGTCTPFDGQKLELKIISPSGGTITYSWNAAYIASATLALPTTSNAASKEDYFAFQYDADKSGWVFLAAAQGF